MVHTEDNDPHVLAALHKSAGCGSSQLYLLFASVIVPLSSTNNVTNAVLQDRSFLFMIHSSQDFLPHVPDSTQQSDGSSSPCPRISPCPWMIPARRERC